MKTILLISLFCLVVWWGLLTVHIILCHRDRVRSAAKLTPKDKEDLRRFVSLDQMILPYNRKQQLIGFVLMSPFIFVFLPYCLYSKFIKDSVEDHDHAV
jgi:hypothetical protein